MYNRLPIICSICIFLGSIAAIEISPKIDFASDDSKDFESSSVERESSVIVVGQSNNNDRRANGGFVASRPWTQGNAYVRNPVTPIIQPRNCPNKPQPRPADTTKNIYIFINGEGTTVKPENFNCRDGVCETILSTQTDDRGNVIGSVRLTVVADPKIKKIEDVPVIDGIHGTGCGHRNPTNNGGRDANHPTFYDNNIPQAPVNRKVPIPRPNPFRPQSSSFQPSYYGTRNEPSAWIPMNPGRRPVDDKIDVPLSQTNSRHQ